MNKQGQKKKYQPLQQHSPDFKNKSILQGTSSPVKQVRLYLQKAKKNQKDTQSKGALQQVHGSEGENMGTKQGPLRLRIKQLQLQNNELRQYFKEYELLVMRNKSLEEQMILLLQQLEQNHQEDLASSREHQPKQQYNTNQSTHSHHPPESKDSPKSLFRLVKSFDSYNDQELLEQNSYLRSQNERIQKMVNAQIQNALSNFQRKFMSYIESMEEKLSHIKSLNQEISQFKFKQEDNSSKSLHTPQLHPLQNNEDFVQDSPFQINYTMSQNYNFSVHQTKQQYKSSSKGNLRNSKVQLQYPSLSGSSHSFGNNREHKLHPTPIQDSSGFKNIQIVQSTSPNKPFFEEAIMRTINHHLSILKQNFSFIFSAQEQSYSTYLRQCSLRVQSQMKDLLRTYFWKRFNGINEDTIIKDNKALRIRVEQLSCQVRELKQSQRQKAQQPISQNRYEPASKRYLQDSYYRNLQSEQYRQFEESKRKLIEVIHIMKGFNNDYRYLLNESQHGSSIIDSLQKDPIK